MSSNVSGWEKARTIGTLVASVAIPVVVAVIGARYSQAIKEQEVQAQLVELAIDILTDPETDENEEAAPISAPLGEIGRHARAIRDEVAKHPGSRPNLETISSDVEAILGLLAEEGLPAQAASVEDPLSVWAVSVIDEYCEVKLRTTRVGNAQETLADLLGRSERRLPAHRKGP